MSTQALRQQPGYQISEVVLSDMLEQVLTAATTFRAWENRSDNQQDGACDSNLLHLHLRNFLTILPPRFDRLSTVEARSMIPTEITSRP